MAKSRINFRFIAIFFTIVALGAGFGGFWYWWQKVAAPERNYASGQRYVQSGDFRKAVSRFGRAANKQQTNVKYLDALEEALGKVVPANADEAREFYNQLVGVRTQRGRATPTESGPWLKALQTLYERNNVSNSDYLWREFATEADQVAQRLPADDPAQARIKYWRAIGFTRRPTTVTEAERTQAEGWLREVVAADPSFDAAWLDLIRSQADAATRLLTDNRVADARARFAELDSTIEAAKKACPDGFAWRLGRLARLTDQLARREPGVTEAVADGARNDLLAIEDRAIQSRGATFDMAMAMLGGRGVE